MLLSAGISRGTIRSHVDAGRWSRMGRHTVGIGDHRLSPRALMWRAIWESGSGSVVDGATSLIAAGLTGWAEPMIHVSVPGNRSVHLVDGVTVHHLRDVGHRATAGLPRTLPEIAAIRAAEWSVTDRQASTLLAMTIQQRLTSPDRLREAWSVVRRSRRRALLDAVIGDVCRGAQSLGELDFAVLCRARGLPEPTRQAVQRGRRGRVYLDVFWADIGLHVEIDGAQHTQGLAPVDDALRQNHLAIDGRMTLRIPVLGLRLHREAFMDQVVAAHAAASRRAAR